jgi:outer membrane protein TolC
MATRHKLFLCSIAVALTAGCRSGQPIRDPDYAHLVQFASEAHCNPNSAESAVPPLDADLEGPHAVDDYVYFALGQNPQIQAARKRVEALAYQVPIAASLQDPMLNVTVQPEPVQTASGRQEMILSASQRFHWFGKLDTRADIAESQTNVARAELAAAELATVESVKRAYYELYFIQQAIDVTQAERELLGEIRNIANTRYATGGASQQDVLRADLEIANIENELIRLRQQRESGQARLARLLHVSPQTRVLPLDQLPEEEVPRDLDWLQRQAVSGRPELHAQLAAIRRDQCAADLARLDYKPDVTLGMSWIDVAASGVSPVANGQDAFLLTAGVNLPVYRKRLDSAVRSAEAKAVATARQYDALRDGTLEEVTDLFAQARSQQELLVLFREEILPTARQTLEVSIQAYNVGEVDFLQLIDNWRQLLRYEISHRRLEASLRQTLATLEKTVGGFEMGVAGCPDCCGPRGYCTPSPLPYAYYAECGGCYTASKQLIDRPADAVDPPRVESGSDSAD